MVVEVHERRDGRDALVGRLYPHRGRAESATFAYDATWLADPRAHALEPQLPLTAAPLQTPAGQPIFGCFSDSAPDRWGRTLISRGEAIRARREGGARRSLGEIDFLLGVRDDVRQGALRFRPEGAERFVADADAGVPPLIDLPTLLAASAELERDDGDDVEALRLLLRAGSSLGGARPKANVVDLDGRLSIAKFPSLRDRWDVMAWEWVALELARRARIRVPGFQLLEVAGRHVLVVERFDRSQGERIGYVSAMTMLEASDGDQRSYLEVAEVIEESSPSPSRELAELWRRMAFGVLISNTDDHLRNHGFLLESHAGWVLSPAFDLNPDPEPGPKQLALAIDYDDPSARVELLFDVADAFGLRPTDAATVVGEVEEAVAGWRRCATRAGIGASEIELMAPAFEHPEREAARTRLAAGS